ncbi:hypothetical protein [Sporosarcina highlanderae]|uniref:Uncharacterized protein n=1 Tax=Sporosarcina highlanderae TaxID=3035916 RepID=A0ABT8JN36_9BACL|nr:hypothetical protein [Sporosarcina highlanderae]MDN4606223.1 hypothetical protein [Sporosarcina highlanderae]
MKERLFWIALGLLIVSWTLNSLYAQSKQLSDPIFLDHYIETALDDHNYLTLYYLTNKNDRSRISHVRLGNLDGYPQHDFIYEDNSIYNIDTYNHHVLRSVSVRLRNYETEIMTDLILNDMVVYFSDGRQTHASIGEVIIHPEGYYQREELVLWQRSGGGSTDGITWHSFEASESLAIEEISFPFNEPIEDRFNFSISGRQKDRTLESLELPIHLDKDKLVTFQINLKNKSSVNPYSFPIHLAGTTEQGKPFLSFAHYHLYPYLTQADVNKIIAEKTRGALGE